jgi:hypothetical protein
VPVGTQDFARLTGLAARDAAQALPVSRFFALSARSAGANCRRFAATRLKFAARLGRFALSAAPHFAPPALSPSIDVRFRALDDRRQNGICFLNPPRSSPGRAPAPAHAAPAH